MFSKKFSIENTNFAIRKSIIQIFFFEGVQDTINRTLMFFLNMSEKISWIQMVVEVFCN